MSKFVDFLRKLGIFRSGSVSGTYTNAKDRPTEIQMDGVYDAKKDLVNGRDVKKVKEAVSGDDKKVKKGNKAILILFLISALIFLFFLIGFFSAGITIWSFIIILVWLFLLFRFWQAYTTGGMTMIMMIIWLVIWFFITLIAFPSDSGSGGTSSSSNKTLTDAPFDKKLLNVTSADGSVTGTIGLVKKKNAKTKKDYLEAYYNLRMKTTLDHNAKCGPAGSTMAVNCYKTYEYVGRLPRLEEEKKEGEGTVSAVYCNKESAIKDPYATGSVNSVGNCGLPNFDGLVTDTFSATFQTNFYSYAEIFKTTTFEIYDASGAWELKDANTASINDDKAVNAGSPSKIVTFEVKE